MSAGTIGRKYLVLTATTLAILAADQLAGLGGLPTGWVVSSAEARLGRPATPRSVAGVARRTTRRVVRRSAIYVTTLPAACAATTINGVAVWQCGSTYYQAYGGRYVVVYVN